MLYYFLCYKLISHFVLLFQTLGINNSNLEWHLIMISSESFLKMYEFHVNYSISHLTLFWLKNSFLLWLSFFGNFFVWKHSNQAKSPFFEKIRELIFWMIDVLTVSTDFPYRKQYLESVHANYLHHHDWRSLSPFVVDLTTNYIVERRR